MPDPTPSAKVLLIAQRDGSDVSAELAFAAGALKSLGRAVSCLLVDYSSTESAVADAMATSQAREALIVSTVEGREMDLLLADRAREVSRGPVVLAGDALIRCPLYPGALQTGIAGVPIITADALLPHFAPASESRGGAERLAADFLPLGGPALMRRTLGGSFFGEVGEIPILATRPARDRLSPVAELARFEAPLEAAVNLLPAKALATLRDIAEDGRSVAIWERDLPDALFPLIEACGARELRIAVRLSPSRATHDRLRTLRTLGVTRVVLDCDALACDQLPGASGTAPAVSEAADRIHHAGMEAGTFLVAGLPHETAEVMLERISMLRRAKMDRVRVIPFEPTGGTPAWHACLSLGVWPPLGELWNREIYRPLRPADARKDPWTRIESLALGYLAEVDVVSRSAR